MPEATTQRAPPGLASESDAGKAYRRDSVTWAAFGALFGFGFLNAILGPALPYIRAVEHISYVVGALHQVAYAVGGGLAGLLAARPPASISRTAAITTGLVATSIPALAVGYGDVAAITIAGALLLSLMGTTALIRVWAALADIHGERRTIAMSEGEVSVSLAGIVTPSLIAVLAATALSWRFAFLIGAAIAVLAGATVWRVGMPPESGAAHDARAPGGSGPHRWAQPTLLIVFAIVALEFSLSFWLASYLHDDVGVAPGAAAATVSGLYAANLAGRLLASRLARRASSERLLAAALGTALVGLPAVLAATDIAVAIVGIAITGIGIGAMFPLTSSVHVKASGRSPDSALGQVLAVASLGQLAGPLSAGAIAQAAGLRAGLLVLPALTTTAAAALYLTNTKAKLEP
jgi:fucose permease